MGDLVLSEGKQRRETLPTDRTHIMFDRPKVGLHMFPEPRLREEGAGADIALVVALDHFSFPFYHGTFTRAYIVVPQLVISEERLHSVRCPTDVTRKHGLCSVYLFFTSIMAVVGLYHRSSCCPWTMAISYEPLLLSIFLRLAIPTTHSRAVSSTVLCLSIKHAVFLLQMLLQKDNGMESLTAEAAVIFLAVGGDVALQLHLCAKGLPTKNAAVGTALVFQMAVFDV